MTITYKTQRQILSDNNLVESDLEAIEKIVTDVGVFNEEEIKIARVLAEERFTGRDLDYIFLFLRDENANVMAYTCYGVIPFTDKRFDLYWIAVAKEAQGLGLGKRIMHETQQNILSLGGKRIYAETSGTEKYIPARNLYIQSGFEEATVLKDFYKDGDDKIIYSKNL